MTVGEAAKRLGAHWCDVEAMMIRAGWLIDVGGELRSSHRAKAGGYLAPVTIERRRVERPAMIVETGYSITKAGLRTLARMHRA